MDDGTLMETSLILVPYHLGLQRIGMGLGPEHILQAGIGRELDSQAHGVTVEIVQRQSNIEQDDVSAIAEINALLARSVRGALDQMRFPIVLAGNCNTCLGTVAGIAARPVGIIWLDVHGDFNTPETSPSGFLDGMSLAIAVGLCHTALWKNIGGEPVSGSRVVHIGGCSFDVGEMERLVKHQICVISASRLRQVGTATALRPAFTTLRSKVENVYLHVDLDVLDSTEVRSNQFSVPGGLSLSNLKRIIRMVGEVFTIKAAAITAYDPACDENDRALDAAVQVVHTIEDSIDRAGRVRRF